MINGKLEYRVLLRCKRLTAWCRMKHVCNHVSVAFFAYQVELCFHHGLRHLQATPWFSFANLPSPLLRMNNVSTHLSIFDTRTMVCLGSDASASPPYRVSGSLQPPELVLSVMHFEGQCLGRSLRGRSYARAHTHCLDPPHFRSDQGGHRTLPLDSPRQNPRARERPRPPKTLTTTTNNSVPFYTPAYPLK